MVFPGSKVRPWRAADLSPPSSAAVMEEYSYTSTHPLGHTGPVTGSLYQRGQDVGLRDREVLQMIKAISQKYQNSEAVPTVVLLK